MYQKFNDLQAGSFLESPVTRTKVFAKQTITIESPIAETDVYYYVYTIEEKDYVATVLRPESGNQFAPVVFGTETDANNLYTQKIQEITFFSPNSKRAKKHIDFFQKTKPKLVCGKPVTITRMLKTPEGKRSGYPLLENCRHRIAEINNDYKKMIIKDYVSEINDLLNTNGQMNGTFNSNL